jgi:hypothetical protein
MDLEEKRVASCDLDCDGVNSNREEGNNRLTSNAGRAPASCKAGGTPGECATCYLDTTGKMKTCRSYARDLLRRKVGECLVSCGPPACSRSPNAVECFDNNNNPGHYLCHNDTSICLNDQDSVSHQEQHGTDTCGCCGGFCPLSCAGVPGAATCTLESDDPATGYLLCHSSSNSESEELCLSATDSIKYLQQGDSYCKTSIGAIDGGDTSLLSSETCRAGRISNIFLAERGT